jgi:hypothetical protein
MVIMREDLVRSKLALHILDGSEALGPILTILNSSSRPVDLVKPIAAILRRTYSDTVHIDAVIDLLDGDET